MKHPHYEVMMDGLRIPAPVQQEPVEYEPCDNFRCVTHGCDGLCIKTKAAPVQQETKQVLEELEQLKAQNKQLLEALEYALEWIDAVPKGTVLPTMPGFDRDYVDTLISEAGMK